jgi:YD repeat-containing protein
MVQSLGPDLYAVTYGYNALGQLTNVTDGLSSVTNWYNNQGLLVASSNAFGQVSASIYDVLDRATNTFDANGVTVTNTFDALNRLLTRGYPDGGVERFGYTPNIAALTSYTNQLGSNTLNLIYDHLGRKTAEIVPTATTNSFAYSPAGDLVALTDGKGQTTTWHFDQFGRATNKVDATDTEIFRYAYDPNGRLTNRWSAAKGNTAYSFDPLGNLTNINYPVSPDISLAYDVFSSTQGDLAGGRLSYWDSYCLARCTCEPGGKAGRLGQNRKEQVPETMG